MRDPRDGPWNRVDDRQARHAAMRWVPLVLPVALAIAVLVLVWLDRRGMLGSAPVGSPPRAAAPVVPSPPMPVIPRDDPRTDLPRPAIAAEDPAGWFTGDDYPPAALRDGQAGVTRIVVAIAADGRVAGCTIARSSGWPLLDANACGLAEQRGRFWPARDAAGRALPGRFTRAIRWQIPRD